MSINISVQPTPNPDAFKFVLSVPVKSKDSVVFKASEKAAASSVRLAADLLNIQHVIEVYFSGSFITVTQDGKADWDDLEMQVKAVVMAGIVTHNPDFDAVSDGFSSVPLSGELAKIGQILDRTIRPALQRDGGDLVLLSFKKKTLTIRYQGACGCCPHAAMGTLHAIQNILREQYDPQVLVEMA